MLDSNMLGPGEDFTGLRENYVIFITENDVLGMTEPIYHVDRVIREGDVCYMGSDKNEGLIEGKMEAGIENAKSMIRLGKLSLE